MKKLKIILQSKKFYILLIICSILEVLLITKCIKYHSLYQDGSNEIEGKVEKITISDDKISLIIKAREKLLAYYYCDEDDDVIKNIKVGSKIKVIGEISKPQGNTVPNTFNYQKYLYNNRIYKTIVVSNIKIINNSFNYFQQVKNYFYQRASVNEYISLFIIGDKSFLDNDVYNSFKNTGVAHLLAISGMHVSVLVILIKKILFFLRENIRNIIIICFLFFYAYLVDYSPSILRVVVFFTLNCLNQKYNLNLKSFNILILTAFMMILINPFIVYNVAFKYSFVTVSSIILTTKYNQKNYFLNIIKVTFFALLFTLPITINMNYQINLITFLSNLILIPFITYILYPAALLTFIFTFLINPFSFLTIIMEKLILLLDTFKLFSINIPKLNMLIIILYYLLLFACIYYGIKKLFIPLICFIISIKIIPYFDNQYFVYYFDVDQGDAMLLVFPHKKEIIMIDTGGKVTFGTKKKYYVSDNVIHFMKSKGIAKINHLILSHGDYDHMGEAINLVNNFKVGKVIFNCGEFNDLESELIKILDKKNIPYYSCIKELNIDNNKFYFLQTKIYDNENDNSNVIYTELDGYKFMFMGDASITTEKEILNKYNLPNIDVLKVGHHGSKTSSNKEFINEINPKYSIISVGKNNRYGHPNKEVLDNLNDSKIFRTDEDGSIMFKIKNNKLKIETCSP